MIALKLLKESSGNLDAEKTEKGEKNCRSLFFVRCLLCPKVVIA